MTASGLIGSLVKGAQDAVPAAGAVGAAASVGAALSAPGWLVALGQTVIVVVFTLRGVDRRMRSLDELRGEVSTLKGRLDGLACQNRPTLTPHPMPCPTVE